MSDASDKATDKDGPKNYEIQTETGIFKLTSSPVVMSMHTRLPEDHPFYALVGRVASEWSHLEHILDETIWDLLRADKALAACVTSQLLAVGQRCNAIDLLGRARGISDNFRRPYRQLRQDAFSVADRRNRIVHDAWLFEMVSGKPHQFRAMPVADPKFGPQEISEDEISDTLSKIYDLQSRAVEAGTNINQAFSILLKKQTS